MSRNDPTEVLVAVHYDSPGAKTVRVSIDGDAAKAVSIPRSQMSSYHLTGKTTQGRDRNGRKINRIPLAHMTIPEWLAQDREFI